MSVITPIINLKPTNLTQEDFLSKQKFGLQPYDRSPNDYLRFVAKIFTAFRDPNDNILNFDPFDDKYEVTDGTTNTTLQATADKSIIAYVDGFQAQYNFVRLTTDALSTDLTQADNVIPNQTGLVSFTTDNGDVITIDKSKYGEYHRFQIDPGICFIDNQLVQITEQTVWWFRMPEVKDIVNNKPTFEMGQFIADPLKVYSLLPNKNYKVVLSYEYISQFESNSARLRFETDETAIDEPYLLIATFSTDAYGLVHQTLPINERSVEKFKHYVIKEETTSNGETQNLYYLKDINPQYLDKKYMANHKNLFIHLRSQLLSILSETKLANTFHCRPITEKIDPSVSSGDMVYYDGYSKRWYPAEVSRQDFDRVHGLYLKNASEGTDMLFTSGIIEISDEYVIMDSENQVLRNLIPGAEYFLAEDTDSALSVAPFIDTMEITDAREINHFTITTKVIAKATSVTFTLMNNPDENLPAFTRTRTFELDPNLGEQRQVQNIYWEFTPTELAGLPVLKLPSSELVQTHKIQFKAVFNMVQNEIEEKEKEIIEDFKLQDTGDITLDYILNEGTPSETVYPVTIEYSDLYIRTNGLPNVILAKSPDGGPIMKLLEILGTTARVNYNDLNLVVGDRFVPFTGTIYTMAEIKAELEDIAQELGVKLYSPSHEKLGLNNILTLLGNEVSKIDKIILNLEEAQQVLKDNYNNARLNFQSQESDLQLAITNAREQYTVVKNTYDSIVSQIEITQRKLDAVQAKIDELSQHKSDLITSKLALGDTNVDINDTINDIILIINGLNADLTLINSSISTLESNLVVYMNNINTLLASAVTNQGTSFDYRISYWGIVSISSPGVNFEDINKVLQRMLKVEKLIYNDLTNSEATKIILKTAETNYQTSLANYTNQVLTGGITFAQQLILLQDVNAKKVILDGAKANYQSEINSLRQNREVRDYLKPTFLYAKDSVKAELFSTIVLNTDPNSIHGNSNLTTFTVMLSKAMPYDLDFEFIYKEDTQDVMRINVPAGSISASSSVWIQMFPDTAVEAGMPKWVAYKDNLPYTLININSFNQSLIDDNIYFNAGDVVNVPNVSLFTIDSARFASNPVTVKKPTQTGSKLRPISDLDSLYTTAYNILNYIIDREDASIDLQLNIDLKESKTNLLNYNTNYKTALDQQLLAGTTTIGVFQTEIDYLTDRINWYMNTTDDIGLVGSNMSYDVANTLMVSLNANKTSAEVDLVIKQAAYQSAINDLTIATDIALGEYLDGIAENNNVVLEKEKLRDRITTMFDVYEERTKILINIHTNLSSILSSGIFSGEWVTSDSYLMNRFEYQNALENILVEVIDDITLLPVSSVIVPKVLEYVIGTNGLQYPMDLQPWLFVKTSGKISTKKYPGATSVGIALNFNTLILNIKHNQCGDISEFLNVYGNENDFNNQLIAKYKSNLFNDNKLQTLSASVKVNNTIADLNARLLNVQTTKTRVIDSKTIAITTSLTNEELSILELLIQNPNSTGTGVTAETTLSANKKEFLIRLIYLKFFGLGNEFDSFQFLFSPLTSSYSSWYATPGNVKLNSGLDPFDPEKTTAMDFDTYVHSLYTLIGGTSFTESTLKSLFHNKNSLYKELDIINYILAILPEPLVDYNAKFLRYKTSYQKILQYKLNIARYTVNDNPEDFLDDFEDPSLTDEYIKDSARVNAVKAQFTTLISNTTDELGVEQGKLDSDLIEHEVVTDRIYKYDMYKTFLKGIRNDILNAIDYFTKQLTIYNGIKSEFSTLITKMDKDYLMYYSKMNNLPNVMWDVFRITNFQRTKWNYTYLALRIMGIQKELNNVIVSNTIQYSPIEAELSELRIKKNAALTAGDETAAYSCDMEINALNQRKKDIQSLLTNMVNEFNVIQMRYNKQTITPEVKLTSDKLIDTLFIQDPSEYNLSYAFAPYPAYKEI